MNDERLAKLLHEAEATAPPLRVRDASAIAMSARSIRRERQHRARRTTAVALSLAIVIGSIVTIGWRNIERDRSGKRIALIALRNEADRLEGEASERMDVVQAVARSKNLAAKPTRGKAKPPRNFSFELDQERERAAAIILQAADQLRQAGRADLASDRYRDLVTLFPDTAATALAHQRVEPSKNRT